MKVLNCYGTLFSNQESDVFSQFGTISLVAKCKKGLRKSVTFSKVPICKPKFLMPVMFQAVMDLKLLI